MPMLRARVDEDLKSLFLKKAEALNLSESELLRKVLLEFFAHAKNTDEVEDVLRAVEPDAENAENEKMTIRLPRFLVDAAKDKAKAKGMATSRWIAALVQSNIAKNPVMADISFVGSVTGTDAASTGSAPASVKCGLLIR